MAGERRIDIRNPIPHNQWEEAYKNAGLSGNAVYEGNGYITYKVDVKQEDLEIIANNNAQTFLGSYDEIKGRYPRLTANELLNDPQSICEMFVQVNVQTKTVSAIIRVDNPMLLDNPVGVIHFDLNKEEAEDARRIAAEAMREFNSVERDGVNVEKIGHDWDGRLETNKNYFNEHFEISMSRINKNLKTLEELQKNYDEQHIERAMDEFYSNVHKEISDLWESYLKVVPNPDKKEVKELNKLISSELEEMGRDTCFDFRELGWKAYKEVGYADRSFLITLKELGERLLTSLREAAKDFLDGSRNVIKNIGDNVKQAEASIRTLASEAKEKMNAARENASKWLSDRVADLKENAAYVKGTISDKTANAGWAVMEKSSSFIGRIADSLNEIKDNLSERAKTIIDVPRHDFERLHNAEGFKSIDPDFSGVKSETTPFVKALGLRVDRDANDNVTNIIYTPRLNKEELSEVVSRSGEVINGKTLTEWLDDPEVKVELSVAVPVENESTAMVFISDKNGELIGGVDIELSSDEIDLIEQVAKEVGGKAILIDDIANMIWGDKFNGDNADKWVPTLKKCSFGELYNITDSLASMRSQEAREGWAMGYLARTEPEKATAKPDKNKKDYMER